MPAPGARNLVLHGNLAPPLKTGLISWWTLEELSGTRIDSFGTNNLTDNNTVTQNPGIKGSAAQFTAANNESLTIVDNTAVGVGDIDFTFCGWLYADTLPTSGNAFAPLSKWQTSNNDYALQLDNTGGTIRWKWSVKKADNSATVTATATTFGTPSTATWMFVCCQHDSVNDQIGIMVNNGNLDTAAIAAGVRHTAALFALGQLSAAQWWNGRIDEVGFWKRLLTASEKTWLYNSGAGRTFSDLR